MLQRRLFAYMAVLLAGCGNETAGSAARAVITWQDFKPACLRLVAQDGADGEQKAVTLPLQDAGREGERVVAVYRGRDWKAEVQLLAEAMEGSCEGPVVARQLQTVVLTSGIVAADFALTAKDIDADGFVDAQSALPGGDCDDVVATVNPYAVEICDGVDNDCRGGIDDGVGAPYYADLDADGYGDAANSVNACAQPQGFLTTAGDCNDQDATVHPDAADPCNGVDDNCNTEIDEGSARTAFFRDLDADGAGDAAASVQACMQPQGYVANDDDCDDQSPDVRPGAVEVCNDSDDNCDGVVDEGVRSTFFQDQDSDGFGAAQQTVSACMAPQGYVAQSGDCEDSDAQRAPGLPEICDQKDNDCDSKVDDGATTTWYADADGDGYGAASTAVQACSGPAGHVMVAGDCDDTDGQKAPGRTETCDQKDNDCDGQTDEGLQTTFFQDQDGDGFGVASSTKLACTVPAGYAAASGDCNDSNKNIRPNAAETCNNLDDNCNMQVDEGVLTTFYRDADRDGSGDASATVSACALSPGLATASGDCDDGNPFRKPGLSEACDDLDNDCDGQSDEGVSCGGYGWRTPTDPGFNGNDWRRAAAFVGGAWAAGFDESDPDRGRLHSWTSANQAGLDADGNCNGSWYAAWADPNSQQVYLGGDDGVLAAHPSGSNNCGAVTSFGTSSIRGVAGVPEATTGALVIYGANSGGEIFKWNLGTNKAAQISQAQATFFDFDAIREDLGYAVGARSIGGGQMEPFILRATGVGTWAQDTLPSGLAQGATLRAVSVAPGGGFAAAVGDDALILVRDPTANGWTTLPSGPSNGTSFRGVVTFGKNLIYVVGTSNNGNISSAWRWNGQSWTTLTNVNLSSTPQDIHGLAPHDLWIVGRDGLVRHWSP